MSSFVHLRLHTEFSLVDGVVRIDELAAAVAAAGMPAVAVTDQSNLFSMVKFWRAAQGAGLKPIVGVDVWVREPGERAEPSRLTLLCMNRVGYLNLTRLVSRSYLEGQRRGAPMMDRAWLDMESVAGLIALSGGPEGDVGRHLGNGRIAEAHRAARGWRALFGDRYYLEVQRLGRADDEALIDGSVALVRELGVAAVATNDVRFLRPSDFEAHEARVCIQEGTLLADSSRLRRYTAEQYLKTPEQMAALFADLPGVVEQSVEIAKRCSLEMKLGKSFLPEFPVGPDTSPAAFLRSEAARGLVERIAAQDSGLPQLRPVPREEYLPRLERELDVIIRMGFEGYFLIVADFIRWARENGVPVGPGRGSGAGSLVAYVLGITDLDPLAHDLLFERFLNPERVSMPDFDVDFCTQGRDRVIDYVAGKYGRERVSQIITYGTMAAKAVVRDVGRVLGHNYGFVDRIAKLIPFELEMTLDKALEKEEELRKLYESDGDVKELIDLARSLEGLTRNAGMHAGGVVIAPSVLTDFAPLFVEEGGTSIVTQFDKDDVEAAGLVKFDFLGLRTLTVIALAVDIVNEARAKAGEAPLDMTRLPLADAKTFTLLKACRTTGVFQLESRGMKDLIRRLQPDRFEDLVALVALFRPGPLQSGMVDDFIDRKHAPGQAIDYLHPALEHVLRPTYGVILYQEQVMQIAQVLAGYTLGGADLLRRAMGKKKAEEMAEQRSIFVGGAVERGVAEPKATHIFDLMEKFAGYGFNKSHSAAYAVLTYETAWLKAHHPAAFLAAVLSSDMDKTDKVVVGIEDCTVMGIAVLPPDVNQCGYRFAVADAHSVRYGLGAVKGVGESAVEAIVEARAEGGAFQDLSDFCSRVDLSRLNRRCLDALLKAGAFDALGPNRATLMAALPGAILAGEQETRRADTGQVDLFGSASAPATAERPRVVHRTLPDWPASQRLAGERETLGLFLSGHPLDEYRADLQYLAPGTIAELAAPRPAGGEGKWTPPRAVSVAGLVLEVRRRGNRSSLILDDGTGRLEATLFDDVLQAHKDLITKDAILLVEGGLRWDDFIEGWRLGAKKLVSIDVARESQVRRLLLRWPPGGDAGPTLAALESALRPVRGGRTSVAVYYPGAAAHALLELGADWNVRATRLALEALARHFGADGLRLVYHPRDQQECLTAWGALGNLPILPLKMTG